MTAMNPLIAGLFAEFRKREELDELTEADAFELFVANLVLGDDLFTQAAATDFLLDQSTMGVDLAVLEVNGQVVWDQDDVDDICEGAKRIDVTVHLIQAKRSASIDTAQMLNFGDVAKKVLNNDPTLGDGRLSKLAAALSHIFAAYAAKLRGSPSVAMAFATTAPASSLDDAVVKERARSLRTDVEALGFLGRVAVEVLGAESLHQAWVRKNHANEVEIQLEKQINLPKMPDIEQGILGIVAVSELLKLVENDEGALDEKVFYDNVRGFKGHENRVNAQIIKTLESDERSLLTVLNNGVTVVAATYAPKPGDAVALSSYQVVNGCQTSHCLHLAKDALGDDASTVFVPIRIVVTEDEDVATRIIQATNSQTEVGANDLVALTKFQKQLEDFYRIDDSEVKLSYERRSGQFFNIDVTKTRVVTISDQMRAISAMFLDTPHAAARYTQRLYDDVGDSIFRDDHRLLPYLASAFAAYRLENAFRTGLDPKYKPVRYHILMVFKYQLLGKGSAQLTSPAADQEATRIIEKVKSQEHLNLFRQAAEKIVDVGGGSVPTGDRLKRQGFTQDLIKDLVAPGSV